MKQNERNIGTYTDIEGNERNIGTYIELDWNIQMCTAKNLFIEMNWSGDLSTL